MGLMGWFFFAINVNFLLFFFYPWMKCLFLQTFSTSTGQYQSYPKKLRSNLKSCKTSVRHHTFLKREKNQHFFGCPSIPVIKKNMKHDNTTK